jgi:hypothetical protein
MMFKRLLLALGLLVMATAPALAVNCSSYPYTLTNGSTADANQVMSNFNSILNCANNNLAHNGANSDITSLSGLTTPLSVAQGGTGNTTGQPSGNAGGNLSGTYPNPDISFFPNYHLQVFTSSGTFTVPSNATSGTVFKFTAIGGGGGGGGAQTSNAYGAAGGAGGCGIAWYSGFSPSDTITVTIGSAGSAGGTGGTSGGNGGSSTLVYSAHTLATSSGGGGGQGWITSGTFPLTPGSGGSFSASVSGTSLTLSGSTACLSSSPVYNASIYYGESGADTMLGSGGQGVQRGNNGNAGVNGGGGSGGFSTSGVAHSGGAGGKGIVIAEWWL